MQANPGIPQRLRQISSVILAANSLHWADPTMGIDQIGENLYKGIKLDENMEIRNTWVKLAEVKVKEVTSQFAAKGTFVSWSLFMKIEKQGEKEHYTACFVQMSHRRPEVLPQATHEDSGLDTQGIWEDPSDIIN